MPLTISVRPDLDTGRHDLYVADGRMSAMPAGPRLFRAPPLPDIQFSHENMADAMRDAEKLRVYLAGVQPAKKKTKGKDSDQHG